MQDSNDNNDEATPVDGLEGASVCAHRWTNLGKESQKRSIGIFDETGVFVTVCRHGVVLFVCDMVQSGEL